MALSSAVQRWVTRTFLCRHMPECGEQSLRSWACAQSRPSPLDYSAPCCEPAQPSITPLIEEWGLGYTLCRHLDQNIHSFTDWKPLRKFPNRLPLFYLWIRGAWWSSNGWVPILLAAVAKLKNQKNTVVLVNTSSLRSTLLMLTALMEKGFKTDRALIPVATCDHRFAVVFLDFIPPFCQDISHGPASLNRSNQWAAFVNYRPCAATELITPERDNEKSYAICL